MVRYLRWREEVNRRADGRVSKETLAKADQAQRKRARQLGTPEPQEQRPGSRSYWQEHGGEK